MYVVSELLKSQTWINLYFPHADSKNCQNACEITPQVSDPVSDATIPLIYPSYIWDNLRDKVLPEKHGTFRTGDFECCLWAVEKPSISRRLWFGVHRANKIDAIVLFLNGGCHTNWFIIDGNPQSLAENNKIRLFFRIVPVISRAFT